ncbi:MAG TPA: PIG-L deacetylase family protein [Sphingomonas sp.]|nr:PIG-L deacetylase family protein [Sphingomonas sp.]
MIDLGSIRRAAIVAPHPDDEVLGCGGTIARLAAGGTRVEVVIMTRGAPPLFDAEQVERVRTEAHAAHARLGVAATHFLDLPAAALDQFPAIAINRALGERLDALQPEALFVPFVGDIHRDHQIGFGAAMVWARPRSDAVPRAVLAYETLSETNWYAPGLTPGFLPDVYIDIAETIEAKLEAFACFASQTKAFPDERSPEAIRALATMRGATVHRRAAEAFMLVRAIL